MINKYNHISTLLFLMVLAKPLQAMPNVSEAMNVVEFQISESQKIKLDTYSDKIILLFFGYTNCPDVCPTTLLDISKTLKDLESDAFKVQAIFVSVGHQRDKPIFMNNYVKFFDKRILGLSSDKKNIDKITKYFKTKYALLDSQSENYIVEHSSNIYIIDTDKNVKRIIASGLPSSEITKAVRNLLN